VLAFRVLRHGGRGVPHFPPATPEGVESQPMLSPSFPPSITLAADPLGHVLDKTLFDKGTFLGAFTMHTVTLLVAAILTLWAMSRAARAIETGPESTGHDRYLARTRFGQVVEVITVYLRDNVILPQ